MYTTNHNEGKDFIVKTLEQYKRFSAEQPDREEPNESDLLSAGYNTALEDMAEIFLKITEQQNMHWHKIIRESMGRELYDIHKKYFPQNISECFLDVPHYKITT
jgi:hypothetical protein